MTYGRFVVAVFLMMLGACASPVESYCATAAECGQGGNETEQQCAANRQAKVDEASAKPECATLVDAYEAMLDCQASLSCEEFSLESKLSPCKAQMESFSGALFNNLGCVF